MRRLATSMQYWTLPRGLFNLKASDCGSSRAGSAHPLSSTGSPSRSSVDPRTDESAPAITAAHAVYREQPSMDTIPPGVTGKKSTSETIEPEWAGPRVVGLKFGWSRPTIYKKIALGLI